MPPPPIEPTPLQWGHAREVLLERASDGRTVVAKRFRHPRPLARLRDRSRARAEFRWLEELSSRGISVPRPLDCRATEAGWVVRMEWIDGVDLRDLLAGSAPWPAPAPQVARSLGRLLAQLHMAGLDHPDLHPGNVLVDADGATWAIDFHRARRGTPIPALLIRDLIALESTLRERAPRGFRLRALAAWRAQLAPALSRGLFDSARLAREVTRGAREYRRHQAAHLARRWLRESELCHTIPHPMPTFVRRGVPLEIADAITEHLPSEPREASAPWRAVFEGPVLGRPLVVWSGPATAARGEWHAAGRLEEHAIPAARPLCLRFVNTGRARRAWAAFELPRGAERCGADARMGKAGLSALRRQLEDRGLHLAPEATFYRSREAPGLWLGPPLGLDSRNA